jgi:hypothetical protein
MNRCKDCAGVCHDDNQCARCRHYEWSGMQNQMSSVRQQREAIDSFNSNYWRKKRMVRNLSDGAKAAILFILVVALIANAPAALDYEYKKIERIRQLTNTK